jgi:hypothetical protein
MGVKEAIPAARVVVCSREASLACQVSDHLGVSVRCRRAATPYEAAAEALAGEADLVVIDRSALTGPHAGLPGLLARHGVPLLVIARPGDPEGPESFHAAHRATPEDLAAAMTRLLTGEPAAPSPEHPPVAPAPENPRGLVSPEELAALLEDRP